MILGWDKSNERVRTCKDESEILSNFSIMQMMWDNPKN